MKAIWNGVTLAESDKTIVVENNHYFPPDSLNHDYFVESKQTSTCVWKGLASYYSLNVNGKENPNAAWYYSDPKDAAKGITSYVAFWNGVEIVQG